MATIFHDKDEQQSTNIGNNRCRHRIKANSVLVI